MVNAEPITALTVQHGGTLLPLVPTAAIKEDHVKIQLSFLTDEPKHVRSMMLQRICGAKAPFIEDVCILMPCVRAFSILEAFLPTFQRLQETGVVPATANLLGFKVLDEDFSTLAYLSE